MDFEQAEKVLQLTDTRIRKFGSIDISTSRAITRPFSDFSRFNGWRLPTTLKKLLPTSESRQFH